LGIRCCCVDDPRDDHCGSPGIAARQRKDEFPTEEQGMADVKVRECDGCQRLDNADAPHTRYIIESPDKKIQVDLCDEDSVWLRELIARTPAKRKRRTFDDSIVASPADIPRDGD
jgi:hypothetical protein